MASYFSGVMVRLMLTLTPVVCVAAAVAVSQLLDTFLDPTIPAVNEDDGDEKRNDPTGPQTPATSSSKKGKKAPPPPPETLTSTLSSVTGASKLANSTSRGIYSLYPRLLVILQTVYILIIFVQHCTWVTSNAYSSPSVVLASKNPDGSNHIIDDFREAYYWLRMNTKEDDVVASWWDYGYQIAGMADRPTMVDNNTWNNTHIATVGKAMSCSEEVAYPLLRKHDVSYVLVIFGGLLGYSGDDINKFLWMVRISQGIWPDEVSEAAFFTPRGEYKVDAGATPTMKNSLMYKLSYYRFPDLFGGMPGQDRVRGQQIPAPGPQLNYFEEAFTSENWIVRIYKVKNEDIISRDHKVASAFWEGKKRKKTKPPVRRRAIVE